MTYESPGSVDEAVKLLAAAGGNAKLLAGGTDLLVQLRMGMIKPALIIDVKNISETTVIKEESGGIRVGAAVSGAVVGEHEGMKSAWPGVVEALELIGSTQIQGRASMGGNLCNGSPAADAVPAMIAAEAVCTIAGPDGRREARVEDIVIGPGVTSLKTGEMIVDFLFPARPARSGDAYLRFIPRTEMDIAVVGVGVSLTLDGAGVCTAARVALGAVAATQLVVEDAAAALIGSTLDDAAMAKLDAAAQAACRPIDDKRGTIVYRTKVAGVLARRAAKIAQQRAEG
ncbi:MAG: xanthine dehydrogenase family protein subunit M [Proteobacteria bacterium]|nr:xanthine dehydrogenase family protein subunit M [Pseudomonadota bacterium]MDA1356994.1 xanthine dehydrogenase family protein subunit M [Pseudomonadota bacterium]